MEDACAVGAGSCALAGSKALRKKKARTSERVMEIPRRDSRPRLSRRAQLARVLIGSALRGTGAGPRPAGQPRAAVPTQALLSSENIGGITCLAAPDGSPHPV